MNLSTTGLIILGALAVGALALLRVGRGPEPATRDPDIEWTKCHACGELMAPGAWGVFYGGETYCSQRCLPAVFRDAPLEDAAGRARKAGL